MGLAINDKYRDASCTRARNIRSQECLGYKRKRPSETEWSGTYPGTLPRKMYD